MNLGNIPGVTCVQGDITKIKVDAIVNAANSTLLGGGGVDGAIHRAAGSELLRECQTLGGCKTGDAKITRGYNLPAQWVIHTVGPVWKGGTHKEEELLAACYFRCLELAADRKIKSIAFPCISTGVYGFQKEKAAKIAFDTVRNFVDTTGVVDQIIFVCFGQKDYEIYRELLNKE